MFEVNAETIEKFKKLQTKRGLAQILEIKYKDLIYNLHIIPNKSKYTKFTIPKKNGGKRTIFAPSSGIMEIQKRLSKILLEIYPSKSCVHGFTKSKSILTNAKQHLRRKHLVNIDLKNFFPTINFGRVQGIFKAYPFHFNYDMATTLAQICCYRRKLPQGAPTSPIISNFVCRKLDNQLMKFCIELNCTYSRYADDITISTNQKILPKAIGVFNLNGFKLSKKIISIITQNDFLINNLKVRYSGNYNRKKVTGIKVNKFLNVERTYIRKVRAMLHAWEKYKISGASIEHFNRCLGIDSLPDNPEFIYERKLIGMIGFIGNVRGKDDEIYHKLYRRIKKLSPDANLSIIIRKDQIESFPILFGEGKTDWKHIKASLLDFKANGLFTGLEVTFKEYESYDKINYSELLKMCETLAKGSILKNKHIFMFDRDVNNILNRISDNQNEFKNWGNNVYSFAIPQPPHRDFTQVCIEHYYTDSDLKTKDKSGRRLYLSNEFDVNNGKHLIEELTYHYIRRLKTPYPFIIDYGVLNNSKENVALSKNNFANNILEKKEGFDNFSFQYFESILTIIQDIINDE